ncbi:MAG: hypothetical protein IPI35_24800 [Deltaproteobacteria bacterium]|nr:hypothetical protein [Deltaproteobacteria bacterium]
MIGTPWDVGGGSGAVNSVNGLTGDVNLGAGEVGADPEGAGEAAVASHVVEADPHPGYQLRSEAGQADGYAQLDSSSLVLQDPASASATANANKIAKANGSGKLENGWGGSANTLATLDASALVPTAQQGSGTADSTKFLRGDRTWATALQGSTGSTDNALLRADGTGGLTAQGSSATLDDSANLVLGSRSFNQPISPSAWSGATSTHDLPIPSWATVTGKYFALVRVRVQQNSTTTNFSARTHQIELTYNGTTWSLDASMADPSVGGLGMSFGWAISGGTNLRLSLSAMGGGNAGNVGMFLEQFVNYGAL